MIAANDLRIGNWIFDQDCKPNYFKIEQILHTHNGYRVTYRMGSISCMVEDLIPIPLTEKILLDCGFDQIKTEGIVFYETIINGILFVTGDKNGFLEVIADFPQQIRIKHLHDLQNIFYSLKKTELIINL